MKRTRTEKDEMVQRQSRQLVETVKNMLKDMGRVPDSALTRGFSGPPALIKRNSFDYEARQGSLRGPKDYPTHGHHRQPHELVAQSSTV